MQLQSECELFKQKVHISRMLEKMLSRFLVKKEQHGIEKMMVNGDVVFVLPTVNEKKKKQCSISNARKTMYR